MKNLMINILQIAGVVFFRFRPVSRIWAIWLVAVNMACLAFIQHLEAQVLFATTGLALVIQALIHRRTGFTRLLGASHLLWIPMFAWLATRLDAIAMNPDLQLWLALVFATNVVSFLIDTVDVTRFWAGERDPHYSWS